MVHKSYLPREDIIKTSIILRFENLSEDERLRICNWLLDSDNQTEIPYRVFYRKGGINNKMIECGENNENT